MKCRAKNVIMERPPKYKDINKIARIEIQYLTILIRICKKDKFYFVLLRYNSYQFSHAIHNLTDSTELLIFKGIGRQIIHAGRSPYRIIWLN